MPFYEYECASCKFYTEVMQKIGDAPIKKCPSCGRNTMKKLISAPVFRLKGGGWYETDFKSEQENKRNLADKPEKEDSKAQAKEEAKGGVKEEAKGQIKEDAKETKTEPRTAAKAGGATPRKPVAKARPSRRPRKVPARRPKRKGR